MNASTLEKKSESLVLSEKAIKIGVIHYFWDSSSRGVNTVVRNSIEKGLGSFYPNLEMILIGENFQKGVFDNISEKRKLPLFSSDSYWYLLGGLMDLTKDLDAIIIENQMRGLNVYATQALKELSEKAGVPVHGRTHDGIWDRPDDWNKFKSVYSEFGQAIPRGENFSCSVLTLPAKAGMQKYYDKEINVIRNSIVPEDYIPNPKKEKELRELLEKEGIIAPDEKIIACPNRIVDRKLIEHIFPLVKNRMELTGEKYRLIVTESIDGEKIFPQENVYQRVLEYLAEKHNIPCSLGKVSKYIDDINFTVPNLYYISDFSVLSSKIEGFGYGNVDPFMCGKCVLIRRNEVHSDFEKYGMDFKYAWDDEVLNVKKDYIANLAYVDKILSNKNEYESFKSRMRLEWRLEQAQNVMKQNEIAIRKYFNNLVSATNLARVMKLEGYQKLK